MIEHAVSRIRVDAAAERQAFAQGGEPDVRVFPVCVDREVDDVILRFLISL